MGILAQGGRADQAVLSRHGAAGAVLCFGLAPGLTEAYAGGCPSRSTADLKKRLFLYGAAHRAQMLAKAQGGRFLALRKVGAELYLAAQ